MTLEDYEFWANFEKYSLAYAAFLCCNLNPKNTNDLPAKVVAFRDKLSEFIRTGFLPAENTSRTEPFLDRAGRERKIYVAGETYIKRRDLIFLFEQSANPPPFLFPHLWPQEAEPADTCEPSTIAISSDTSSASARPKSPPASKIKPRHFDARVKKTLLQITAVLEHKAKAEPNPKQHETLESLLNRIKHLLHDIGWHEMAPKAIAEEIQAYAARNGLFTRNSADGIAEKISDALSN